MRTGVFLILLFTASLLQAQRRVLVNLDTNWVYQNQYIREFKDWRSFFNSNVSNEEIDPQNPDEELICATIFFSMNKLRVEKKRTEFKYNDGVDCISKAYASYSSRFKFIRNSKNQHRLKRYLHKVPRYQKFEFTFLAGAVQNQYLLNYVRGNFFYSEDFTNSEFNLYFGNEKRYDTSKIPEPITSITYLEFANRAVKKWSSGKSYELIRSKAFDLVGVATKTNSKGWKKKKIPSINVIFIVGGFRNRLLYEKTYSESDN